MSTQGQNTTGTYSFQPSMGETVLYAYGLCGIRRAALLQEHFEDARMAMNLLMAHWSAKGVNLWQVDLQTITLNANASTYPVPSNTIVMLDSYVGFGNPEIDRLILPVSRTEYASYPNKAMPGFPTTYWFDRLLCPTVTLWPVPNGQQSVFKYYRLRQTQDSELTNGAGTEVPIYLLAALAFGLAEFLSFSWAPDRTPVLAAKALQLYNEGIAQNVEQASQYISPQISGYFRT